MTMTGARWQTLGVALLLAAVAFPATARPAGADEPAAGSESAEALFNQGLDDMLAEKYDTGCPALARSYELEPLPGALFTLAECEAKWGKLASAWRHYREYLTSYQGMPPEQKAQQQERRDIANEQSSALKSRVPTLFIRPPADMPADTIVSLDGEQLEADALGEAHELDPGPHEVTIEVPSTGGRKVYPVTLEESVRESVQLELPEGERATVPPPAEDESMGLREWSYVVGGVGIAGVLIGTIAGAVTIAEKGTIEDNCVDTACNHEGLDAADSAQTSGAVSTVGFIVGGAALAAATVMFLLDDDDDSPTPAEDGEPGAASARLTPVVLPAAGPGGGVLLGVHGRF